MKNLPAAKSRPAQPGKNPPDFLGENFSGGEEKPPPPRGKLAVGVVLFRSEKWAATLGPALAAALEKTPAEIFFLSAENREISGAAALACALPGAKIFDAEGNPGFAGGQNFLFSKSRAEFFLALNPDTDFDPDFFENLLVAAEKCPRGAAFGPLTFRGELRAPGDFCRGGRIDTAGIAAGPGLSFRERAAGKTAAEFFGGMPKSKPSLPPTPSLGEGEKFSPADLLPFPADAISGSAILLRRSAVARIPGGAPFCGECWMYFEDVDFGLRARRAGFENFVVLTAKMWHGRSVGSAENASGPWFWRAIRSRSAPPILARAATRNWLWTVARAWPALPIRTRAAAIFFGAAKFFFAVFFERNLLPAFAEAWRRRVEIKLSPEDFSRPAISKKTGVTKKSEPTRPV